METKIFKSINLIRRGSGANLNLFRYTAMVFVMLLGAGSAWGGDTYYAKVTASPNPTGAGSVYVNTSNSQGSSNSATSNGSSTQNNKETFYLYATTAYGYKWSTWTNTTTSNSSLTDATKQRGATYKGNASGTSSSNATEYTVRGDFTRRAIEAVGTPTVTSLTSAQTWRSHSGSAKVEFQDKYVLNQSDITITYPSDIATVTKTLTWTTGTTNNNSDGAAVTNGLMVVSLGYNFSNPTNLVHNPSATMTVRERSSLSSPSSSIDKTSPAVAIGLDLTPVFSTDKTSYTFPATEVNTSAQTTISATSYGDLPIGNAKCAWSYTLSGTNADQFGCSVSGGVATVTYHPNVVASHTATLTMTAKWTDANGAELSYKAPAIALSGSATAPDFSIGDLNYATTTDIGTAVKTLTLQDVSYVTSANIDFSGDNASCFSATSYNTTTKSFDITFTAPVSGGRHQAGTYTATATVTGNAAASNVVRTATLTAVVSPAALASFNVPNAITFNNGEDMESGTTDDQTITLTNMQNVVGTPTITIDGTDASMYAVQGDYDSENHAFTIRFTASGTKGGKLTADATVTVENYDGETLSQTVELNAFMEEVVNSDVRVTNATGGLVDECDWAKAIKDYQVAGYTFTLLRHIDLGTITATNEIKKAITIDLNGKTLRAAVNATSVGVLTITAAVELTIKDSRGGGKIINEIARNSEIRTIFVNAAGASLTLESGTLAVNNLGQYASKAATVNDVAVAQYSGCTARVIHQVAGSTVNINGGKLDAKGTRSVYGIVQGSSASTNNAGTTVLNVTGGEIAVEAPYNALGIYAYGKVNMSAGVINTHITTDLIDAAYAADHGNNTNNGSGYGILMKVSVSATASSCYYGTLNMTGGTINVISDRTKAADLRNYGIYLEAAATGVGAGKTATDGTLSQKASAKASIENANITVHSNTYYSYGIIVYGSYNSYDNEYFTVPIKNCNIDVQAYLYTYAICANAAVNSTYGGCYWGDVELTGNTVTAESVTAHTAYAVYVLAATAHIFKDANTTTAPIYYGEYATAAKAVINNGTYTAKTKTTTAYAVCSSTRAKTIYDSETQVQTNRKPGGNAEAYPVVIIHGGTFRGEATTTTSRAVSSGGYTTIDGGTFEAFSTSTTAYGLYAVSGKLTASGATISANATQSAYGAYADCGDLPAGNTAQTGFAYAAEMELNNCDITATTRTSTEARGVVVNAKNKMHNWKQFQADSTSYKWATTTYDAYKSVFPCTIAGRDSVGIAIAAKATINGCDIKVTAGTTTAYGVYSTATSVPASADSVASPIVNIKNSKFTVKTDASTGSTTAIGVYAGGPTTIDGCDFTVQPKTTTAKGVYAYDKKTTITNTKFDVKATSEARLFYAEAAIGSTTGWDYHGEFELGEGNECVATSTGGNTAHILTLIAKKLNIAKGGAFDGDYANAASALVTGGSYKATATGTTCYAVNLSDKQVQNAVSAAPSCTIEGGKFWAMADGGTTGICSTNGVIGNILFKGGFYNVNTTLSKHIPEGYEEFPLPSDRPEYSEGYRYAIEPEGMHGIDVCKIGNTKFKSLEEALQVVTSGQTIVMIANYTLSAGDYILPSGANLLVPRTSSQTSLETTFSSIVKYNEYSTPSAYLTLTFAPGARLDVGANSVVQVASLVSAKGQMNGTNGAPYGPHGKIVLQENSQIILEDKAKLYAWGYITGAGMIDAKKGSTVYECMQIRDWRGGTNTRNIYSSVFPFNQYFIQNVESKIRFRPGSEEYGHGAVNASSSKYPVSTKLIGTSDALFLMNSADVSADTWVQKSYDFTRDYQVYEVNSAAQLSNLVVSGLPLIGSISTADYTLPLVNNMHIHLLSGKLEVIQDVLLQPGVIIEIDKEAKCVMKSGKKMYVQDSEDTQGYDSSLPFNTVAYSPQGSVAGKRTLQDASINMHGAFEFNGYLYTSEHGANIFSTNEDAGTILFKNNSPSNATLKICNTGGTIVSKTFTTPKLKNGEGETPEFTPTSGSVANDEYAYYLSQWRKWVASDCFTIDKTDNLNWKYYIKPAEYVQVTSNQPDANKLHHDAATGARNFVWDENCYWWEVVTTPTAEGYYRSINADHNGKYNYYYYDSSAGCWKIKKITVTWNINGSNTNYSVGYGTKPEWLGATPTKSSSSTNYVWRWDGWTRGSSTEVLANTDLPIVTENTTFTAHFYEKYYEYNIIFKNSDGTILDARNWKKGDMPSYDGTPTKNPTAAETYEFDGTWTPSIYAVDGAQVYVANYTTTPRTYTITFLNFDMSELGTTQMVYNGTPSNATYLAAVAPIVEDPYKPDNSAFSFEFAGWRLQGASSNGFAQVKGDQTYIAQYNQTNKKYRIEFVDEDETLLHYLQLEYGEMPSYSWANPADKQDAEWSYVFTGWDPSEFTAVEGAQTYKADYDKTKREYTITWKDGNGGTLKTDQVAYGETPAYNGATPTKTSTNTENFTFNNSWSPAITAVTGEETYTAQFNATERKYRVTWDANSGTCGTAYTDFSYNTAIGTLPSASKTGYTFNGWFTSATGGTQITTSTKVTADVTYHAQFAPNPYTITFNSNGGSSVASITQNYGTTITAPADPIREGYTFKGWSPAVPNTMPLNGTTCVAQWTINQYTITFDSKGGSLVASITQNYGTAVTAPADPTREGYTFNGWNPDVPKTMPANGAACIAQWTANTNTPYTVKHYKQKLDGTYAATPDETDNLTGTTAAEVTPARKSYEGFEVPAGQTVTILANGSLVVTYQYTRNSYNLSWSSNGGNELTGNYTTGSVKYGASITAPNDPTRTGYSFSGWSPAYTGTMPATNTEYQAQWTPEKRTVTWKDGTTTIKIEEWNYDSKPSFNYVKTPTAQYSFPLLKWEDEATGTQYDPDNLPLINADVTYKAIYGNVTNKYTIRFVNDQGTELQVINDIPYGEKPVYTKETPASEIHDYYIREFKGWYPEIVEVEGHTTYTARYEIVAKLEIKEEYVVPTTTIVETTTVEVGGSLNVASEEKLTTTDLIIESSADEDWNEVTSGEVVAVESAISADNAYYDMKPAGGYKARIWYAVAVPWTVDVPTGVAGHVYDANGRALRLDIDFDLLYYDGAQRAAGGTNNWRYVAQEEAENQVMKPGKAYMIYLASPTSKLRFEKSSGKWLTKELSLEYYPLSTGDDADANWNGIANPAIYRAYLNAGTDGNWGQVFVPGSAPRDGGTYAPVDMSTYKLAVGQPIFVQAENTEKETVVAYQSNTDYTNHAPRRAQADAAEQEARYAVEIAVNGKRGDRIFIATDEDKEDVYTIGRDVVKMGLSNTKPQMWINRYDSKLCVNTIEFNGTTAVYPLTIQIPTEGEYSLYTPSDILTGHELYLTYNGRSIWNLRYAPYVDTFTAGTHAEYGLKLVRSNMPTDIDQTGAEQKNVRKMIVDDHVYIIRGNNVYTVDGQLVK